MHEKYVCRYLGTLLNSHTKITKPTNKKHYRQLFYRVRMTVFVSDFVTPPTANLHNIISTTRVASWWNPANKLDQRLHILPN